LLFLSIFRYVVGALRIAMMMSQNQNENKTDVKPLQELNSNHVHPAAGSTVSAASNSASELTAHSTAACGINPKAVINVSRNNCANFSKL
jgi:hypothetical protein